MKINAWTLLLAFVILYFVFQIREDVLRYYRLVADRQEMEKSIREIMASNRDLNQRISALNDNYLIESLARERLNLIKKGETAYKVCRLKSDRM
jgi:cell division protein FtsB